MVAHHHTSNPPWTWAAPILGGVLLALKFTQVVPSDATIGLILAGAFLGAAVFAAVHHAEILALKLGEPFGSILLAVAVTVIEVALIVSVMLSETGPTSEVARDTVFAAVMIVLNGVIGLCLVMGGSRHYEQTFQLQGASSSLAVLGTLAALALILPNYTLSVSGPSYSAAQLIGVGLMSLVLWGILVFVQTIKHRAYFLDAKRNEEEEPLEKPTNAVAQASLVLLLISLTMVVLLAKLLSYPLDRGIQAAGLPKSIVGVLIAALVLLPEGLAAARSALMNRVQNSINLALGSAIASIGLTIPTVAVVSLLMHQDLILGISPANMTLLVLTLFVSTLTLGTGRTTVLQGAVHLVIFSVFLLVSAVP